MKLFNDISKSLVPENQPPVLVHAIHAFSKMQFLDEPLMSDELSCPMCSGRKGIYCLIDPKNSPRKLWFCADPECLKTYKMSSGQSEQQIEAPRALDWKTFCECSGLGDVSFGISFDKIEQSEGKIRYLRDLAKKPSGLLVMQGDPGTGKTYSALALCELFTRRSSACVFQKAKKIESDWLESFSNRNAYNHRSRLTECSLLVVDDFGLKDPSAGFLDYFLEILDARLQWSDRVTVITTNLEESELSKVVGESLADRLRTGQLFQFTGASRRQRQIL